jgi:DNA-binding NarL/FixJ family response regulator
MRLVIVEDDPLLLENLKLLLSGESGIIVVGAFSSAEDALHALRKAAPDVMLADLGLPGMSGIDLIKKVKEQMPGVEIMAHTVFEDRENVFSAIKAGASGYILKGSSPREIVEAIHELHKGGAPMSPKIARKVIHEFQDENITSEQYILSQREKDVVKCIEEGLTYKEISKKLNISSHTVHTHIKNIYEKLHAIDRGDALNKARKTGII